MTNANTNQVVGKAIYLEFVKPNITMQVLILPEAVSSAHRLVPMTMFRRRLSISQPRKTWSVSLSPHTSATLRTYSGPGAAHIPMSESEVARKMSEFTDPAFDLLISQNWPLYKDPIVVEVTTEDMEMARQGRTPYKVLGRVNKVRKNLGYPKEIVHGKAAEPTGPTGAVGAMY
jgi:hypothetical protein